MTTPTSTHLLSGAGGDTKGLQLAGFKPVAAINHLDVAIRSIRTNFPDCDARVANVEEMDMRRLPHTNVLCGSPICTELAPAGRISRADGNNGGRFGRTRATALALIAATEAHRYDVVMGENVIEFVTDWALFDWWVEGFRLLGYKFQLLNLSAAHIGGPGNAPAAQDRDRVFFVFTRNDIDMPTLEPRPPADCPFCGPIRARQQWRRAGIRVGKHGQQYDYVCPTCRTRVKPHTLGAETVFDLSDRGEPVGNRYVPGTRARIQDGLDRFGGRQFVATLRNHVRPRLLSEPLTTVSAGGNHHLLVTPRGNRIADCYARIITPREQARAQRFGDDFVIHGTGQEQTMQAGNAVAVNCAQWIGEQVYAALGTRVAMRT